MTQPEGQPDQSPSPGVRSAPVRPLWMRSLLEAVMAESVDPSYAKAARAQQQRLAGRPSTRASVLTLVAAALLSLITVITFAQARSRQEPLEQTRQALEQEIGRRQATTQQLQLRLDAVAAQIAALEGFSAPPGTPLTQPLRDSTQAGLTGLSCPGVELSVHDLFAGQTQAAGPRRTQRSMALHLSDRDLQRVVNGLWHQGAQAVSINGHRLLATTAIRQAGQTILVDYQPLLAPYVVRACGEGQRLTDALRTGAAGQQLRVLQQVAAVSVSITQQTSLVMPGVRPHLRYVEQVQALGPAG